ncbi:NDP-hexose 2,3-dehydratase [Tumebacillus algifaecis]|uniref:NDP-hexose 2,3-dehydratase n=1 Tax=Tumebacillus algifaecis TaxID=1214604 RepID=A0A223D153_9BACL|nr:adaptor protein MecA [Tumebacillus algifaecis]ASS75153.1 NDP-hexose 2,3-dehydratase [Tumebacillus algifaecis]
MRVEKLGDNKVRIMLSYDDLDQRGIDREEIWQNGRKVQELFWDMMEKAYLETGFEVAGPIAVEAFTMPTEGVVVVITQLPALPVQAEQELVEEDDEADAAMDSPDPFGAFTFVFQDLEDVIRVAHSLQAYEAVGGTLYHYKERYHLFFDEEEVGEDLYDTFWSILHEYGELSPTTKAMLDEYGKRVMDGNAVQTITQHFPLR